MDGKVQEVKETARTGRRLLLLGGSGFVSGTLAAEAAAQGWDVWAVTRGGKPLPSGVHGLKADRKDTAGLRAALASASTGWDLAVDCIAYGPEDARQDLDLLPGLAGHLALISTDFVYDPSRRRFPQPEEAESYLTDESYGAKKRRCERELLSRGGDPAPRMPWTVVRPCHIYGPGSLLGCLPFHGRDPDLIARILRGEALRLVGGGHFLQQPVFARDLARLILSFHGNAQTYGRIFNAAGPDVVESVEYYRIVGRVLGRDVAVVEEPVGKALAEHPEYVSFFCHRIYDRRAMAEAGVEIPSTPLEAGLRAHTESLLDAGARGARP